MIGISGYQLADKARATSDGQKVFAPRSFAARSNAAAISESEGTALEAE